MAAFGPCRVINEGLQCWRKLAYALARGMTALSSKSAIDCQIEERVIAQAPLSIDIETYGPYLLLGKWTLGAASFACNPRGAALKGSVVS